MDFGKYTIHIYISYGLTFVVLAGVFVQSYLAWRKVKKERP